MLLSIYYLVKWEGVGALEIDSFLSPVKRYRADRPKKLEISRAQPPPTCPSNKCCPQQKHYARGRINHTCIGGFMYTKLWGVGEQ